MTSEESTTGSSTPIMIEPMTIDHYADVVTLWRTTENIGLSSADEQGNIASYLSRNPDLSFVAVDSGRIVGVVLCGHDGRRGYIHHLTVMDSHRRKGIAKALVDRCIASLRNEGIQKCHTFVYRANQDGTSFWQGTGWTSRSEVRVMSKDT
jgi:ribosomal protein S18 acetylase RimI-like enzyme